MVHNFRTIDGKKRYQKTILHSLTLPFIIIESNPVQRANREIGRLLRICCHENYTKWVQWLSYVEYWINNVTHSTTELTPHHIMFGNRSSRYIEKIISFPNTEPSEPEIIAHLARENIRKKAIQRQQKADKAKRFINCEVGQEVLVKTYNLSSGLNKR